MAAGIVDLAKAILANAEVVDASLKAAGQPDFSLGINGGRIPPTDTAARLARLVVKTAAQQLIALLRSPREVLLDLEMAEFDLAAIQVIHRFQIANSFPVGETTTYASIASNCAISENQARRILRYAMTSGIFVELQPEVVAHTALSKALAQDIDARAEAAQIVDEQFPAAAHLAEWFEKFGDSQEGVEAAWAIANRASKPMLAELNDKYPVRARQFSSSMNLWASRLPIQSLLELDIGGGKGYVSIALAQALPDFTFTVQDYPDTIADASEIPPPAVRNRITYQAHDFITSIQPVEDASVYFFCCIFHDWPDRYCIQILRNLIPALKPGSLVILNELCLTSTPMKPALQRTARALDMAVLSLFNGQQRGRDDFIRIFRQADERFDFVAMREPVVNKTGIFEKGLNSIVEFVWIG